MLLYKYILFFLGFYTWNYKPDNIFDHIVQKKYITEVPTIPLKNNKNLVDFLENDSASPRLSLYIPTLNIKNYSFKNKIKFYLYSFYSFLIFCLLCIQPSYLLYCIITKDNKESYSSIFFLNIITPVNYIWGKMYFKTNHFKLYTNQCTNYCTSFAIIIIILTLLSIAINFIDIDSFYNEYYYIHFLPKIPACIIVSIEWLYSRLLFTLTASCFTVVFCNHVNEIKKFINNIIINEFDLEDSYCLTKLISNIASLRHTVEISIEFYNFIISFVTSLGAISFAILIRHKYNLNEYIVQRHEIYLIQCYIVYLLCQIVFFYNVIRYSVLRNRLIKLIQSSSFVNKFLTRWTASRIKHKCKEDLSKIILCIEQENATSLDWLVLDKLTSNKWMDFQIMGISTQDGSLIKKVVALSSIYFIVLGYL